jgi:hypothetical protein
MYHARMGCCGCKSNLHCGGLGRHAFLPKRVGLLVHRICRHGGAGIRVSACNGMKKRQLFSVHLRRHAARIRVSA